MHRLSRLPILVLLSLGLALTSACKRGQTAPDATPDTKNADGSVASTPPKRGRRQAGLPRPLRLPADAPIVVHVESPGDTLAGLRAYAPELPMGRGVLEQLLEQVPGTGALERELAGAIDLERPFDVASAEGQLIIHVPIVPGRVGSVAGLLSDKPPVGRFGAVDLQRGTTPGPKLAWLDRETNTITLADDERGLATGRHLAKAYGKEPLRVQLHGDEVRKYVPQLALEHLELHGAGTHDFEAQAKGVPPEVFAQLEALQAGALTGLLESPRIAVGASSKYTHYERDVKKVLADAKRTVDRQSFLVKGTLEDLLRRFGSVARSWNGRTMIGVGPKNHVLIGLGATSPQKMGGALFHLITGVIDNLDLARSLGISVPKIRFQRNKSAAAGHNISVIALEDARRYLPPEAAPLLDGKGDLRIAVAFPERSGAGMAVAGPDCHTVLGQWLDDTAKATPGNASEADFLAATVAIDAAGIEALMGGDLGALLGLSAARAPTRVTVARNEDLVNVRVQGPELAAHPRRVGAQMGRPKGAAPVRAPAQRTAPGGKPARAQPSASKPIR